VTEHGPEEGSRRARARPFRWLWRELSRIRLAVWLLIIMAVTMIVGSVFPQGYGPEMYIASWGEERYAAFAKWGLLNLFHTKYFLILGAILLLNLVFCSLIRWSGRRGAGVGGGSAPADAKVVELGKTISEATTRAKDVLRSSGYKVVSGISDVVVGRRGPWPEGVSLLYHLAMAVAIIGFILSALFSFEGDVTLYQGEPESVPMVSTGTGAFKFRQALADWEFEGVQPFEFVRPDTTGWEDQVVTLTLDEFRTEWELYEGKYYPKDWISELTVESPIEARYIELMDRVVEAEGTTTQKDIIVEVNRPLRRAGLTFYQMAYEQSFDVVVRRGGRVIERVEAQSYVPFMLDSVDGMFFPGTLRVGTLFQKYLEPEPIVPHIPLKWQPPEPEPGAEPEPPVVLAEAAADTGAVAEADTAAMTAEEEPPPPHGGPPERVEIGDLSLEEPLEIGDVTLRLENPYEGSILSYRHDPGVPLLYIAIVAFLVGLAIRTYWPSYRVRVWVEPTREGVKGRVALRATGMLGEPDAVEKVIMDAFGAKEEAPKEGAPKETTPPEDEDRPVDPMYFGQPGGGGSFGRAGGGAEPEGDAGPEDASKPPGDKGPGESSESGGDAGSGGAGGSGSDTGPVTPTAPNP
jgi:cytochrome c biogenesis protein ResB